MQSNGRYNVLQCSRCRSRYLYRFSACPRCGTAEATVVQASRRDVEQAALQFLALPQEMAMPRAMAEERIRQLEQARQTSSQGWLQRLGAQIDTLARSTVGSLRVLLR